MSFGEGKKKERKRENYKGERGEKAGEGRKRREQSRERQTGER